MIAKLSKQYRRLRRFALTAMITIPTLTAIGGNMWHNRLTNDYNQVIKQKANEAEAYYYNNRDNSYFNKGEFNRAINEFIQALKRNPNDSILY